MGRINQPSKEQVRAWLSQRRARAQPLPDGEQIRRQLGWEYCAPGTQPLNEKIANKDIL